MKILIVDDDRDLAAAVAKAIENAGFRTVLAATASDALRLVKEEDPDLMILDLTLPDMDGIEVCREVHRDSRVPVIMLTARTDETERVVGLEVGADDYVTKPFSVKELIARVKAVLRRVHGQPTRSRSLLRAGDIELDVAGHVVNVRGTPVELTRTEFLLLQTLMQNLGTVVRREDLARAVWGTELPDQHLLEVHISNLRRKIEKDPRRPEHLLTVRAVGYKMV
ncbi:MAG: response regulator transcription factor [Armatimonadetes bacterium]|nr:response regulator transcription factor [Armatimonadota bacterium]